MACIEGVAFLVILSIGLLIYAFSKKCPSTLVKEIEYISIEKTLSEKNRLSFSLQDEEKKLENLDDYNVDIMQFFYDRCPSELLHQLRDFSRKSDQVYFYKDSLVFVFPFFNGNEAIKSKIEERYSQFVKVRYEDLKLKEVKWFDYNKTKPLNRDKFMN